MCKLKAEVIALTEGYLMYIIYITTIILKGGGEGVYFMVSFQYSSWNVKMQILIRLWKVKYVYFITLKFFLQGNVVKRLRDKMEFKKIYK